VQDRAKNFKKSVMTPSTGELHTPSGEWLSNVFLALAKFAVRRPKTRWVHGLSRTLPNSLDSISAELEYISFSLGQITRG
jgi:hypothetical protein